MDIRGLIVLIITTGITAMLVIGIIGAAFWGKTLTSSAVESLSTVLGMLIGVISSYVAGQWANRPLPPKPEQPKSEQPKDDKDDPDSNRSVPP